MIASSKDAEDTAGRRVLGMLQSMKSKEQLCFAFYEPTVIQKTQNAL